MMSPVQRLVIALALAVPLVAGLLALAGQGRAADAPAAHHGVAHQGMHHGMQADAAAAKAGEGAAEQGEDRRHAAATAQDCCLVACPVMALEHAPPVLHHTEMVTSCSYVQRHDVAVSRVAPPRERPPRLHG